VSSIWFRVIISGYGVLLILGVVVFPRQWRAVAITWLVLAWGLISWNAVRVRPSGRGSAYEIGECCVPAENRPVLNRGRCRHLALGSHRHDSGEGRPYDTASCLGFGAFVYGRSDRDLVRFPSISAAVWGSIGVRLH
jgi:hypothetical protein